MSSGKIALAASMIGLAQKQSSIANNLANMQSPAFKGKVGSFAAIMRNDLAGGQASSFPMPVYCESSNFSQGDMVNTHNKLDVAINGKGFFKIKRADGEIAFTRSGSFQTDREGYLTTPTGDQVLQDTGEPIQLNSGDLHDLVIDEKGELKIMDLAEGKTTVIGRLGVFRFVLPREATGKPEDTDMNHRVVPIGGGLYQAPTERGVVAWEDRRTTLTQGALERSNIDSAQELVRMLLVERTFEACGRTLRLVGQAHSAFMAIAKQG